MPLASQTLSVTQQPISDNFQTADDTMARNHQPMSNGTATLRGKHKFVELEIQPGAPVPPGALATDAILYTRNVVSAQIPAGQTEMKYIRNGGSGIQLTGLNPVRAANGSAFLPGELLIQWGTYHLTFDGSQSALIPYTYKFSALPYCIQLTVSKSTSTNQYTVGVKDTSITAIDFRMWGSTTAVVGGHDVFWLAIGPS
jgi:hypothetical protein